MKTARTWKWASMITLAAAGVLASQGPASGTGGADQAVPQDKGSAHMAQLDAQMDAAPRAAKDPGYAAPAPTDSSSAPYQTELTPDVGYSFPGAPLAVTNEFFVYRNGHNYAVLAGMSTLDGQGAVYIIRDPGSSASVSRLLSTSSASAVRIMKQTGPASLGLADAGKTYMLDIERDDLAATS
jgi:hypothetical protein